MLMFERPIPGQSLTAESRSQAFERPPEITDPIEALDIHIENLSKEGAMEGIHSIDISLIIATVLHEHIKGFADVAKLDYDEGFDNQEGKKALAYKRDVARAKKMMKKLEEEGKAEVSVPEPMEEPKPEIEKQEPDKSGLMARM